MDKRLFTGLIIVAKNLPDLLEILHVSPPTGYRIHQESELP
jgi:hypothetical protein